MDPTAPLTILYDSLNNPQINIDINSLLPLPYSSNIEEPISVDIELASIENTPPPIYCDIERYNQLKLLKDKFDGPGFDEARLKVNPFEAIGRSIFQNRAAIKIANIDAIYHISNSVPLITDMREGGIFTYLDIAAGPGGFTEYIQFRRSQSIGWGMTLKDKNDWNLNYLDLNRFTPLYGEDQTGNLYTNWIWLIGEIITRNSGGVDLVMADGGFEVEKEDLYRQEWLSSKLFAIQAVIGCSTCKEGGNFVLKAFDTVTSISADILYLMSRCFAEIIIFKPISSRPANSERYVICRGRKGDEVEPIIELLIKSILSYQGNTYLNKILSSIPKDFIIWLTNENNRSINLQTDVANKIISLMEGRTIELKEYNLRKCLIIWNLPSSINNEVSAPRGRGRGSMRGRGKQQIK